MCENDMKERVFGPEEVSEYKPIELPPVERIGDFMVRNGNEAAQYVGKSTVIVIPEEITGIDAFLVEGKPADEVHIPSTVVKISGAAFFEATSLGKIIVDEANPVYCSIDGCLYSKDKKSFIYCSDKTEPLYIAEGCEVIESYAFFKREVGEIIFPSTLKRFAHSALCNCTMTADELVIPHDLRFDGGEWFNATTLPPRVTVEGMIRLPSTAFAFSTFGSMRLSDTLTEIEDFAFGNCLMRRVYVPKSVVKLGKSIFESDRPFEGVESSDAFYAPTDGCGLYGEEDGEEYTVTVDNHLSYPDGFVLGVDNEECAAAQYARENDIPYEVVTDIEAFLNVERPQIYHIYEMRMKDRNKQTDGDEIW